MKSLLLLHQTKPLSFREKKMLDRARYLLVSELAMAKNVPEEAMEELLTKTLAKAKLKLPEVTTEA
jgi:CarD family transcriptional regulator